MAADPSRAASPVQRLGAAGYDWLFDRVDPLGGADHRRLCTVPDLAQTLAEARRVLRPAARSGSTSTSGPTAHAWPAGRTGWSDPWAGWPEAATDPLYAELAATQFLVAAD